MTSIRMQSESDKATARDILSDSFENSNGKSSYVNEDDMVVDDDVSVDVVDSDDDNEEKSLGDSPNIVSKDRDAHMSQFINEEEVGTNRGDHIEDQPCLINSLAALKSYFYERLVQVVGILGGDADEVQGWGVQVTKRSGGLTMGVVDVEYVNTKGRRFRNRVEVACFLGLMPPVKNIRSMTRDQLYLGAIETRETVLVSQQLGRYDLQCRQISFAGDAIKLTVDDEKRSDKQAADPSAYFSFGNLTVLSWGRICLEPSFHTATQIFPLGFRCLRQEHDVLLDRVVDCLCEIDSVQDPSGLLPLFRVTVAWDLPLQQKAMRVYEARTPQQVWQAVMLERVGLSDDPSERSAVDESSEEDGLSVSEPPDEEERLLRADIREQRRTYFRSLRAEQSLGLQAAVKPRLAIDSTDSFGEELVLRLVEGMEGSAACRSYQFLDCREKEAGKKHMLKAYSKMFAKAKALDKVIAKHSGALASSLGPRKRRVEDSDVRKRVRGGENKEHKALTVAFLKNRAARVREIEKGITLLKAAVARSVKKRRDDAKVLAEQQCEREELVKLSLAAPTLALCSDTPSPGELTPDLLAPLLSVERPRATTGAVLVDSVVFGQVLEVREFVDTFHGALGLSSEAVPSVATLAAAVKTQDPALRCLTSYTMSLTHSSFEKAVEASQTFLPKITASQSGEVLNRIGVALCTHLMRDFERIMGIDLAESQLGPVRIPVNELTWKEVARVVLLSGACREVGMQDSDIASLLKGRGFFTTPESADRKALKLARRRILFAYTVRDEFQEAVFGFGAGQCVRVPAPSAPFYANQLVWTELVSALRPVPPSSGWLIFEVISAAALSVGAVDNSFAGRRLKKALLECIAPSVFKVHYAQASKDAALQLLSSQFNSNNHAGASVQQLQGASTAFDSLRLVCDSSPDCAPLSSFDLWERHRREVVRRARQRSEAGACLQQAGEELVAGADLDVDEMPVDQRQAIYQTVTAEEASVAMQSEEEVSPLNAVLHDDEEGQEAAAPDLDTADAEKLSIAMQRCYLVVRDLMMHPQAVGFNSPADYKHLPAHNKLLPVPLWLADIRSHLVEGGYADSLFAFYSDVSLLLESVLAHNVEHSAVKVAALKLQVVFERMFFETVLCWDNPLPFHDCCHACRSSQSVNFNKVAVCDRCEGVYHLHCLDPPLQTPPRSEWYCLPCVEQRGIANAHPYKTADVAHPSDPETLGEVVGIEQEQQTVMFVVEFGSVREKWSGGKVRAFAVHREEAPAGLEDGATTCRVGGAVAGRRLEVTLPSGYEMEDYDRVSGIARAYVGWSASQYLVPAALMDAHSLVAKQRAQSDGHFQNSRLAIAALTASSESELGMREWATLLRAVLQRALGTSAVSGLVAQMDEGMDDECAARLLERLRSNDASLAALQQLKEEDVARARKADTANSSVVAGKRGKRIASSAVSAEKHSDSDSEDSQSEEEKEVEAVAPRSRQELDDEEEEFDEQPQELGRSASRSSLQLMDICSESGGESSVQDSESESEEEDFFDAQGNCLTSGSTTTAASQTLAQTEEQWEVRLLSRQKGREDALLTQVLLWEVLHTLDVDGQAEEQEEGYGQVCSEIGSFYKSASNAVVKACMGRPSESLVIDDWCVGWEHKMQTLMRRHSGSAEAELVLCPFCGFEESFLGSPFVRGQTLLEYEADLAAERAAAAEDRLPIGEVSSSSLGTISASTGIKGFRARNRAMNGLLWMPVDAVDAETETRECVAMGRSLKAGSLVVHECCADFMHFSRQQTHGRSRSSEDSRIVEMLLGLSRGKTTPLGVDRAGHLYWAFLGSSSLLVSASADAGGPDRVKSASFPAALDDFANGQVPGDVPVKEAVWSAYTDVADIGQVIRWLDPRIPSERILSRTLILLFPAAAKIASSLSENDSVAAALGEDSSAVEEEDVAQNTASAVSSGSAADEDAVDGGVGESMGEESGSSDSEQEETHETELNAADGYRKSRRSFVPAEERLRQYVNSSSSASLAKTDSAAGVVESTRLRKGELVLVETSCVNGIKWEARILDSRVSTDGRVFYRVHFQGWSQAYDGWYSVDCLTTSSAPVAVRSGGLRPVAQKSRADFLASRVAQVPSALQSLSACQFMLEPDRACGPRPPLSFSDCTSTISLLRCALLMVEAALPLGAVDENDDRWGDNFVVAWRQAVLTSQDAASLMQCQIMLEYGVKTAWLRPTGLKMFSCLPSRVLCLRNATLSLVAIRIWVLDATVRYDKLLGDSKPPSALSNKGRPGKSSVASGATKSRKR